MRLRALIFATLLACACSRQPEPAAPNAAAVPEGPATFVNRVWAVSKSPTVAAGTLYAFLSEGTMVITSPWSKPALGSWQYQRGTLVFVEEGIAYPVDVLSLTADGFTVKIHNPGEPVEIEFVPADRPVPPN